MIYKRGKTYWYEFLFSGKRVRESAKTTSRTLARDAERVRRRELEQALTGIPAEQRLDRIKSVNEFVRDYLETYSVNHRKASVAFATGRLANVTRLLGSVLLSDLTEQEVRRYMKTRQSESVSGRTINAELGELSRAIGKTWSILWPRVRKMEERKDVGRALATEEEQALFKAVGKSRSSILETFVRVALLTAMRSGEILSLTWGQVDFGRQVLTVGRAKTASGTGREIPINRELLPILAAHAEWFTNRFGSTASNQYLFPYGKPTPNDPSRPTTTIKTAWNGVRREAKVVCRLHDLRHTALTKLAESGASEGTMLALAGHMSRAMLERYSHIRMAAKREAVEAFSVGRSGVPTKSPTVESGTLLQ